MTTTTPETLLKYWKTVNGPTFAAHRGTDATVMEREHLIATARKRR